VAVTFRRCRQTESQRDPLGKNALEVLRTQVVDFVRDQEMLRETGTKGRLEGNTEEGGVADHDCHHGRYTRGDEVVGVLEGLLPMSTPVKARDRRDPESRDLTTPLRGEIQVWAHDHDHERQILLGHFASEAKGGKRLAGPSGHRENAATPSLD